MEAKDKAMELFNSFEADLMEADVYYLDFAKKRCALIAVDLRLEADFNFYSIEYGEDSLEYWELVKTEINKL